MTKIKTKHAADRGIEDGSTTKVVTLSDLKQNAQVWYKIHVLLYDICNIATDHSSEMRTLSTTDELYISSPYFTPSESALIKATVIEYKEAVPNTDDPNKIEVQTDQDGDADAVVVRKTIEEAIKERLSGFFDKRRASGDARPCGPHDMAPVYESIFGISRSELQDERFLSRLRRSGLGGLQGKEENEIPDGRKKGKKQNEILHGKKKGKKGHE